MINGGVARVTIERCCFEEDIGAGCTEPFADVVRRFPCGRIGEAILEQCGGIEAICVGDPSDSAGGNSCEAPINAMRFAEVRLLREQEADEFLTDVAEADESEIVSADGRLLVSGG